MLNLCITCTSPEEGYAAEAIVNQWYEDHDIKNPSRLVETLEALGEWEEGECQYLVLTPDNGIEGWIPEELFIAMDCNGPIRRFNVKLICDYLRRHFSSVIITVDGEDRKVEKTENGIQIGCTEISMEKIEEIYKLAKS